MNASKNSAKGIANNEILEQLFKRAGGKTSVHNLMSNPPQKREYRELWNEHIDKFAELIIAECAMLVEGFILEQEVALDDYQEYEASAVLKEHFGIKDEQN